MMNIVELYKEKDLNYYDQSRLELLEFVPHDIHMVLDVGCGRGNFGRMLKETRSCTVWGIEPDYASYTEALTKLDHVRNHIFDKSSCDQMNEKFDCIFFNDVLEHLIDPDEALRLAGSMLKKGGYIVASIPNIRFYPVVLSLLRYHDFVYVNAGVLDKTHLRFFTKKSIQRLFSDNNFNIQRIEGINGVQNFRMFNIINTLLFNKHEDMKYPQFAIVSKLK